MSVQEIQGKYEQEVQSQIITPELKDILKTIIGQKSTILCISIVKLYTASQKSVFKFSNLTGLLCLVWDRERQAPFFRMFSPESLELIFECELYIDFHKQYKKFDHKFYVFEFIKGFIGFSFAFESECDEMYQQIQNNSPKKEQLSQEQLSNNSSGNLHNKEEQKQKKELFGFRRGLKKLFHKSDKMDGKHQENQGQQQQYEDEKIFISKPIPLPKPKAPIALSNSGTLDINTMDEKMKSVFQNAGITEQELNNKDFAPFIFDALVVFNENISEFINEKDQKEKENQQLEQISQQISQVLENNQNNNQQQKQEEQLVINNQNIQGVQEQYQQQQQQEQQNNQNQKYTIQVSHPSQIEREKVELNHIKMVESSIQQIQVDYNPIQQQNQNSDNQNIQLEQKQDVPQPPALSSLNKVNLQQTQNQPQQIQQQQQNNTSDSQGPPPINSILNKNNNDNQGPPPLSQLLNQQNNQITAQKPVQNKIIEQKVQQSGIKPENRSNLLDQIRSGNFQLKKASDRKVQSEIKVNVDKTQESNLTNYLAQAIAQRRNQLKKNYLSSSTEQYTSSDQYSD